MAIFQFLVRTHVVTRSMLGLLVILQSVVSKAVSLEEVLEAVEKSSYEIKQINLNKQLTRAQVGQLRSNLFPKIDLKATSDYGNKTLTDQTGWKRWDNQSKLSLNYPVFSGGSEWTYFTYKKTLLEKEKSQSKADKMAVYQQLIDAFFTALKTQNSREKLSLQINSLKKRIGELKNRVKIGRSRSGDLLVSQSQLSRIEAEENSLRADFLEAKKIIIVHTGGKIDLKEPFQLKFNPKTQMPSEWAKIVVEGNQPQLLAAKSQVEEHKQFVKVAQSDYLPSINITSSYYLEKGIGTSDDWEVGVQLTLPLVGFGETYFAVDQEKVKLQKQEAQLRHLKGLVQSEWETIESVYTLQFKQSQKLKEALTFSQKNYREQLRDYNRGLVNNIEVSQALDILIQAEVSFDNANFDLARIWYLTKAYLGDF